ncbi:separin protein [Marasmius crinis-equi]|uniref:separase n=1 Tax=Marasmius crinis-equi TaxID=585013 RepID=A0ABR3FSU8_9AGAR
MPPAAASRRNPTRQTATTSSKTTSVDRLAEQLATKLTVSKDVKGKQKAPPTLSPEEQRAHSMRTINSASQHLSSLFQSGWRLSQEKSTPKSSVSNDALASGSKAVDHLVILRRLCSRDVDIERAAMSVLGKLVALELYEPALQVMRDAHGRICDLAKTSADERAKPEPPTAALLSVPIPEGQPTDNTTLTLISTYLFNAIAILCYYSNPTNRLKHNVLSFDSFSNGLLNTPTLLQWMPHFSVLPAKHLDPILTKAYSLLTKLVPSGVRQNNPSLVFQVRMYAVSCLAYTSQGVIDNPSSLWNQASKFAMSYAKSEARDSSTHEALVPASLAQLVRIAEMRPDCVAFMSADGFMSFCETWTSFANRAGDLQSLDRIGTILQNASMPSSASTQASGTGAQAKEGPGQDKSRLTVDGTRLCTTLAQLSTLLENAGSQRTDQASRIEECTALIQDSRVIDILAWSDDSDKELHRISGKVHRALEKCRRFALKLIEKTDSSGEQCTNLVRTFVDLVLKVLEQALARNPLPDYFTQMLDASFSLAKTTLTISDPRTYTTAYDYLDRAVQILDAPEADRPSELATYLRCTSGAFHNLGGILYQGGRYGSAIPYLKESCRLGARAIDIEHARKGDDTDEVWMQLEEQLWRRWQLLAICYTKIGDRRAAFNSLQRCVEAFPYERSAFADHVNKEGLGSLFDLNPTTKDLVGVVDRLTHMGVCELLLAAREVSLRNIAMTKHCLRGALVERQLEGLEPYRHKEGIAVAMSALLKDALELYQDGCMPLRSVRVYVRALSFAYHNGVEHISSLGSIDEIAGKIKRSLDIEDFGHDKELVRLLPEYQAAAQIWLSLHAHRTSDPKRASLIRMYTEEACKTLHTLVSPPPRTKTKTTPPSKPKAPAGRLPKAPKSRAKAPITPKPRGRAALQALPINTLQPEDNLVSPSTATLDTPHKLVEALQLSAHVLGILSLNILKIKLLDILRRIAEQYVGMTSDAFIMASSDLGYEYLLLGKFKRARKIFELTQTSVHNGGGSESASGKFLLKFAELCALNDDITQSMELYRKAQILAGHVTEEKQSSYHKMQARVVRLELAAMASNLLSVICSVKNDHSTSLRSLLNALRLWNRAYEALARLQPPSSTAPKAIEDSNPFDVSESKDAPPIITPQTSEQLKRVYTRRTSMSGFEWRIGQGLLQTMFALCQAYLMRGSSREAQYFAEQARDLAESLNAPVFVCRAVTRLEELRMQLGQLEELDNLDQLDLTGGLGIDVADVHRLRGDFEQRVARIEDAQSHYEAALQVLEEFDQAFGKLDGVEFGPRHSIGSSHGADVLTPALLIRVLREHIWILRDESGEQFEDLLNRLLAIPPTLQTQTEKDALMAKLTLHDVYTRSKVDMFLSSIGETTVALPMGSSLSVSLPTGFQDILRDLESAEKLFWSQLSAHGQSGHVPDIRAALSSIALIGTFQASLGRSEVSRSMLMAGLLDASAAITLRREMLEVIQNKYPSPSPQDDLLWPTLSPDGALVYPSPQRRKITLDVSDDEDENDDAGGEDAQLKRYWDSIRERYQSVMYDAETLSSSAAAGLPSHWTVVHITVTDDKNTLFISRQRGGTDSKNHPLLFCIPLKGRREGAGEDEEQQLTFEDAIEEFNDIIRSSNETTKAAASIRENQAARATWWRERGALDTRLQELLENIEFCWLGAFKTILHKNTHLSPEGIASLRVQFDRVFQQGLRLQDKRTKEKALGHGRVPSEAWGPNRVTLDDALLECFSTLSPQCKDEELEDLVYFILDLYQFHGVQVAIAEIDIDQVVVDLRSVLEEHAARMKPVKIGPNRAGAFGHARAAQNNEDEHLFLVLDKNVQGLPWESIPILRGRSVSRIPCMSFLHDRLEFARWKQEQATSPPSHVVDRAAVDPRKGYYILNPSGDLTRTQGRFEPWLKEMKGIGWDGISGRQPSELEVLRALEQHDLVVYFGHGGGEQYVRSHKIRHLRSCAAVMLWGCSSGYLRDMGDFDRVGTPLNYMLAGCPALVANLWDVTDRDIDTFSQGVFDKLHMNASEIRKSSKRSRTQQLDIFEKDERKETSLMAAVAQSREVCKLKYLTGAAPVVYGIPFYL